MKAHGYCPKCSTKHVSTLCPKCYSNLLVDSQTEMAEKRIKQMKDDSLNYIGTSKVKIMYGGKPINQAIADGDTKMDRECKPDAIKALAQSIIKEGNDTLEKIDSVYHKEIWNAAIEAAALVAIKERHNAEMSDEIRKLKK